MSRPVQSWRRLAIAGTALAAAAAGAGVLLPALPQLGDIETAGPVLQQATLIGAEILGQQGQLGEVTPGAIADLLLVDGDPLVDLEVIADPERNFVVIVKDGRIVKRADGT